MYEIMVSSWPLYSSDQGLFRLTGYFRCLLCNMGLDPQGRFYESHLQANILKIFYQIEVSKLCQCGRENIQLNTAMLSMFS